MSKFEKPLSFLAPQNGAFVTSSRGDNFAIV